MDHIMSMTVAQVADLFFGADAYPHDYLHEVLFRLLAVGWVGAATQNLVNKVCTTRTTFCCCAYSTVLGHGFLQRCNCICPIAKHNAPQFATT